MSNSQLKSGVVPMNSMRNAAEADGHALEDWVRAEAEILQPKRTAAAAIEEQRP